MVVPGPSRPLAPMRLPARVSSTRRGDSVDSLLPGVGAAPVPNQPTTSMSTSAEPSLSATDSPPLAPTRATTRLATVSPAEKLRFDVAGVGDPAAYTVA